mgnify:FL=1
MELRKSRNFYNCQLLGVMFLAWSALSARAEELTLAPVADTYIATDTVNFHMTAHLQVYTSPVGQVGRVALLQWAHSSLPPLASTIAHATLSMYLEDWRGIEPYHVTVHRIINRNADLTRATGFTYDGARSWAANNCCFAGVPMAQSDIAEAAHFLSVSEQIGRKFWHVTTIIQHWVNNPTETYGLLMNAAHASSLDNYRYFASLQGYTDRRPQLEISYTTQPLSGPPSYRVVRLSWADNSEDEDGFYVERRHSGEAVSAFARHVTLSANEQSWTDIVAQTVEFCYRVQAFNATGTSAYTNQTCACRNLVCRTTAGNRPGVTSRDPVTARPPVP